MRRIVFVAAVILAACHINLGSSTLWGHEISDSNGVITMDGVRLEHDRWVDVDLPTDGVDTLAFATATGPIDLNGAEGGRVSLRAHLYSEVEGDGEVVIENGRLTATSAGGHKVFVNGIEGTVPETLGVDVSTGTGAISVAGLAGAPLLHVATGTGRVELRRTRVDEVKIETGTGDVLMSAGHAGTLGIDTGTGALDLEDCEFGTVEVDSGTGDLFLKTCRVGVVTFDSGTGDLVVDGGEIGDVTTDQGAGDISISEGALRGSLKEN